MSPCLVTFPIKKECIVVLVVCRWPRAVKVYKVLKVFVWEASSIGYSPGLCYIGRNGPSCSPGALGKQKGCRSYLICFAVILILCTLCSSAIIIFLVVYAISLHYDAPTLDPLIIIHCVYFCNILANFVVF